MGRFLNDHVVFPLTRLRSKDSPGQIRDVDKGLRRYADDKRVRVFTRALVLTIGLSMLVGPIRIFAVLSNPYTKLAVITVFIVVFLSVVASATGAAPAETLAATAA